MRTHEQAVHDQFDSKAEAYLHSRVHSEGPDLRRAQELVASALPAGGIALDLGCGGGHLSFTLAPSLARIIAVDPSLQMVSTVARTAVERGLPQIETRQAVAESLPFEDASFDLVATRYSAHHWGRLEAGLMQMRRVMRPGGRLLVIDVMGHQVSLVDTHLQSMELLRDPSHVRNRAAGEWRRLMAASGFQDIEYEEWPTRLEFGSWVRRMATPLSRVAMIREVQQGAPREVQEALAFEADGTFTVTTGLFWAR
jgi:ubiquinone/menaquinone biosynthesis C-methylase UbiE